MREGGEMGMIQLASAPMLDPDLNDQRPRPVNRVVGDRDIINNELGIFYNGYESQTGKPVLTGPPTREFQAMFDVAPEGYKRVAATLWPNKTSADSLAAGKFIHDTGYDVYGGYLQGMLGANPRHEPQIGPDRPQSAEGRYLYDGQGRLVDKAAMMFTLQMHIIDKQETRGLFLADSFVVTANGPKCSNKFPAQLVQVGR
jgi:Metallopeptidase family M24